MHTLNLALLIANHEFGIHLVHFLREQPVLLSTVNARDRG
jgi:hypothetical protein